MCLKNRQRCTPCAGGTCSVTVTVSGCSGAALSGASVTVTQGGTTFGPSTTDGSGQAAFTGVAAGTYTVSASATNFVTRTGSFTATCPGSNAVPLNLVPSAGRICCSGENIATPASPLQLSIRCPGDPNTYLVAYLTFISDCFWQSTDNSGNTTTLAYYGSGTFGLTVLPVGGGESLATGNIAAINLSFTNPAACLGHGGTYIVTQ